MNFEQRHFRFARVRIFALRVPLLTFAIESFEFGFPARWRLDAVQHGREGMEADHP
jgi:hypothetical protein